MKILTEDRNSKLCHARPGDTIQLHSGGTLYLVCVGPDEKGRKPMRVNVPQGLYDEGRELFLVNLQTGQVKAMINLSARVTIRRDIAITSNALPETDE